MAILQLFLSILTVKLFRLSVGSEVSQYHTHQSFHLFHSNEIPIVARRLTHDHSLG